MIFVACFFLYLAIGRGYEPLLLVPIAFGMLLVNLYPDIMKTVEEAAADGSTSVSYTHLDVYKRQVEGLPSVSPEEMETLKTEAEEEVQMTLDV